MPTNRNQTNKNNKKKKNNMWSSDQMRVGENDISIYGMSVVF